ncbi:MAG: hypothetical protein FWE30_07170 [Bacteroidales bacterium]|nr:hypothetical protein [Bacteroidales bacterium]
MAEMFDKSPRTLQFYCWTERIYSYCNYVIDAEHKISSNDINIVLRGIGIPHMIMPAFGPATGSIDLGSLRHGSYRLNLTVGGLKRTGTLVVSPHSYIINFEDNADFGFINTPLHKMPEHTIWGHINYYDSETSSLAQSFLTALVDLGAEKKAYLPGYYSTFAPPTSLKVDEDGGVSYSLGWANYEQAFMFHYSGKTEYVADLVKQYARDYKGYMQIAIFTDKREEFLSWSYLP